MKLAWTSVALFLLLKLAECMIQESGDLDIKHLKTCNIQNLDFFVSSIKVVQKLKGIQNHLKIPFFVQLVFKWLGLFLDTISFLDHLSCQ